MDSSVSGRLENKHSSTGPIWLATTVGVSLTVAGLLCFLLSLDAHYVSAVADSLSHLEIRFAGIVLAGLGIGFIVFRSWQAVQTLSLFLISVSIGLGLAESWVRTTPEAQRLVVADSIVHHSLKPLAEGVWRWGGRESRVFTNSLGYRDRSRRIVDKEPDGDRILFSGDSFTVGVGVEYDSTYASLVETSFRDLGVPVEVLNSGVASYSPRLSLRSARRFLEQGYSADLVVLALDVSDLVNEGVAYRGWTGFTPSQVRFRKIKQIVRPRLPRYVSHRIAGLRGLLGASPPLMQMRLSPGDDLYRDDWPEWKSYGAAVCTEAILEMRRLSAEYGASFAFFIYPHPQQIEDSDPSWYREYFRSFAEQNDLAYTDLFDDFKRAPGSSDLYIPGDIHWTERGHSAVAGWIVKWIRQNGSLAALNSGV